ncbi:NAD(P)/FAD-dependent oxidoreductase [Luteirhabdus pelagi]|uniref:NAD(P)/FAD-dependent oxidoreductase n=1 Tax=Luteirhabdus pelagi TaxID=2792783 RepID=UPI00193AA990|nr:FAD-dependent oxidoreductase [Luteirhabdus pelagi]
MKEVDYIVVGLGIAGIAFCERLEQHGKSFIVYETGQNHSTTVSGGVFNPVVLKRFTPAWNGQQFLSESTPFYTSLAKKLKFPLFEDKTVLRVFQNREEQNDWFTASDKNTLAPFLDTDLVDLKNASLKAEYKFGAVSQSGRIRPNKLFQHFREYLQQKEQYAEEVFQHTSLLVKDGQLYYKNITAKKILFAEGFGALQNPFFPKKAMVPNKGEYLLIKAPDLHLQHIVKGTLFIIPVEEDVYKVGATYNRNDTSTTPTIEARDEIERKLQKMISCEYEVIDQIAGVRPTVPDRKPLLGQPSSEPIYFLNGLGTRGIMMAPLLSKWLYDFIENEEPLPSEVNIKRYV